MKFTIRDLFLVTVIVALVLGWWLDRSRLSLSLKRAYRQLLQVDEEKRILEAEIRDKDYWGRGSLPTSSAAAPIPPKNQSGPHNHP